MYNQFNPYVNPFYPQQNMNNRYQPMEQPVQQQNQINAIPKVNTLFGKSVDSVDVVKAIDIPLDGSISYFPLTDGTAIVTKQLQQNGTSKLTIYKPVEDKDSPKYATIDDIDKKIESIDLSSIDDLRDDLDELRKELKDIKSRLKNKKED